MAGCGTCPDMVQSILVNDVVATLQRVRQIKRLVTIFNRAITDANAEIVSEIYRLIDLIPHPPVIDLKYIVDLLTCPLTAQAIIIETADNIIAKMDASGGVTGGIAKATQEALRESAILATLDPRALLRKLAKMIDDTIKAIFRLIDEALVGFGNITGVRLVDSQLADSGVLEESRLFSDRTPITIAPTTAGGRPQTVVPRISAGPVNNGQKRFQFSPEASVVFRVLRRILMEIASAIRKPVAFLFQLGTTTASVALVRATCPDQYYGTQFETFTQEMTTFSFDGLMPPGLSDLAKPYAEAFMLLLARIAEWQTAALIVAL
jgi:hypothetical protein